MYRPQYTIKSVHLWRYVHTIINWERWICAATVRCENVCGIYTYTFETYMSVNGATEKYRYFVGYIICILFKYFIMYYIIWVCMFCCFFLLLSIMVFCLHIPIGIYMFFHVYHQRPHIIGLYKVHHMQHIYMQWGCPNILHICSSILTWRYIYDLVVYAYVMLSALFEQGGPENIIGKLVLTFSMVHKIYVHIRVNNILCIYAHHM